MPEAELIAPGTVWLVGAGPGDPDLLTRKAERLIRQASVIFHDALVGPGVLELVPPQVRLVSVGKRSGRHSKDQRTIDVLIVEAIGSQGLVSVEAVGTALSAGTNCGSCRPAIQRLIGETKEAANG